MTGERTYMINAILVEQMSTFAEPAHDLADLKVAKTDQTSVLSLQCDALRIGYGVCLFCSDSDEPTELGIYVRVGACGDWLVSDCYVVKTASILHILVCSDRCFCWAQ